MILSFKTKFPWGAPTNFEQKILDGTKIHTIREGGRWKPGHKIHMANGVRTKNYRCFDDSKICKSTQSIVIINKPYLRSIEVDNKSLYWHSLHGEYHLASIELLVRNDGFDSVDDFFRWFDTNFEGTIIHWTDFKY